VTLIDDREKQTAVDGGDGSSCVNLSRKALPIAKKVTERTASDPMSPWQAPNPIRRNGLNGQTQQEKMHEI
jgi:hypothetical protein